MKDFFICLLGAIFIAVFAQVSIDLPFGNSDIPVTGQTFAVLLVGYILGWKKGINSVLIYLFLGIIGLPVFASGNRGIEIILGNSGGFLLGFIFGAVITGYISQKLENTLPVAFLAMIVGSLVIILFGVLRLSFDFGIVKALEYGFYPFVAGAVVKIVLGALVGFYLKKLNFKLNHL